MHLLARVLLALTAAYGVALLLPLFRRRDGRIPPASWCLTPFLLACPLLVPADQIIARALTALPCTDLFLRVTDYLRHSRRAPAGFVPGEYRRFLVPFPFLLVVFQQRRRLPRPVPPGPEIARVLLGGLAFGTAYAVALGLKYDPVLMSSHLLDHVVKLALFVVAVESMSRMMFGLERLAGFDTRPIIRNILLSRTPAEFWARRYNHRVSAWLDANVFRPAGGRRAYVRGILLVFFVSAALHELMFDLALSRIDRWQFVFFMLQAPAVLLSGPLERLARWHAAGKATAHAFTFLWMAATSLFFFRGVDRIFPFYYASEPWLP